MTRSHRWVMLYVLAAASLFSTVGCGGGSKKDKIWIYQIPDFYAPELKRVAVLSFADPPGRPGVGRRIGDQVAALLTNNRTYEVYTREHLRDILAEKDLADADIIDADTAMEIGKAKSVQALIVGRCNRFDCTTRRETRYNAVPIFGNDANGNVIITGYNQVPYQWVRHEAFVNCNVTVIDCKTGRHIAAVNDPMNFWADGSPPKYNAQDCMNAAEQNAVINIVRGLAVTRTEIKLKGDPVKTATELYDNKWDFQRNIPGERENFFVVIKLPPEADRNQFKVTIVPKEGRDVLAEQEFTWSKQYERFGYSFPVKPLLDKNGYGEYKAKLYSGPEPIATYNFKIVEK